MLLPFTAKSAIISGVVKDETGIPIIGAIANWKNSSILASTDDKGYFTIEQSKSNKILIIKSLGYSSDSINVNSTNLSITLNKANMIQEVQVSGKRPGLLKSRKNILNVDVINSNELVRAACCNLGESFTTNPSVDVSYSDVATGAKQIKLLGLSGTYVQMLTENIPNYRGAAIPYSLGYIPGPWMQSIQVAKGASSVKNGYEAITGQINIEFKKPQSPPEVNFNLYGNHLGKMEANFDANIPVSSKVSTGVLAHYENSFNNHDDNGDSFLDQPKVKQYNLMNRWTWINDRYIFQAGISALKEKRIGGQIAHNHNIDNTSSIANDNGFYKIDIDNELYNIFTKNAYIINKAKGANIALILSGSLHNQNSFYGKKIYNVDQSNIYSSLMFETNLNQKNSISTGLSFNFDKYNQEYLYGNVTSSKHSIEKESTAGAYFQYTFNANDKFIAMGGVRIDHSDVYGTFITPRAHIRYAPNSYLNIRISAGKGYRSNHVLAENNYLMASGRQIIIYDNLSQEKAWNYGISSAFYIPIFEKTLNVNAEYYFTNFINQVSADLDSDPHSIYFRNLSGKSYSHTFQIDATYPVFRGFNLTAAYRYNDVKTTYNGILMERPLTSKYKSLITASYQTPLGLWQFDCTLQLNGGGRLPKSYTLESGAQSWASKFSPYLQLNAQVTRWFRHWSVYIGGENIGNFKQKNPIINASNSWSENFDSTIVWGPTHGSVYYIGFRMHFGKS